MTARDVLIIVAACILAFVLSLFVIPLLGLPVGLYMIMCFAVGWLLGRIAGAIILALK